MVQPAPKVRSRWLCDYINISARKAEMFWSWLPEPKFDRVAAETGHIAFVLPDMTATES